MCQVCKALLVLFIVLTTMQAFFAYFWLAPACAVVLFRRSAHPGTRVQFLEADEHTTEHSAQGWQSAYQIVPYGLQNAVGACAPGGQEQKKRQISKRQDWNFKESIDTQGQTLRVAAKAYIQDHGLLLKPLAATSF